MALSWFILHTPASDCKNLCSFSNPWSYILFSTHFDIGYMITPFFHVIDVYDIMLLQFISFQ